MRRLRFVVEITTYNKQDKTSYRQLAYALQMRIRHGEFPLVPPFYPSNATVLKRLPKAPETK